MAQDERLASPLQLSSLRFLFLNYRHVPITYIKKTYEAIGVPEPSGILEGLGTRGHGALRASAMRTLLVRPAAWSGLMDVEGLGASGNEGVALEVGGL